LAAHFAKRSTKFGGGGKRGRAKIPSPQPPSFLPARASGFVPAAHSAATIQFLSKNVRAELYNSTSKEIASFEGSPRFARRLICIGFSGQKRIGDFLKHGSSRLFSEMLSFLLCFNSRSI